MNEDTKKIEKRLMPYRFWLFAAISAFLVVTFAWYLPARFQLQGLLHMREEERMGSGGHTMMEGGIMAGDEHRASTYHEEQDVKQGLAVNLNLSPAPVFAGTTTRLEFFVNTRPGDIPVPVSDLQIEHEKLMHVIGIREDMEGFFHIHPFPPSVSIKFLDESGAGHLGIEYPFSKPGRYKIWSQIKKDGVDHTFGHPPILVLDRTGQAQGGTPGFLAEPLARNMIVDNYQVTLLFNEPAVKNQDTQLAFEIHTLTGKEVEVEPYLGADMHLTLIKDDWKQFIHTHPEGHKMTMNQHGGLQLFNEARAHGDEETPSMPINGMMQAGSRGIQFHINFPEAGLYKAFVQFRPKGIDLPQDEALTASFWIKVENEAPVKKTSQATLVLISLVLIAGLSFEVKRFLEPKV